MIPKGIIINYINTHNTIIRTHKRELVFADYFGLFFVFWGFFLLVLGRFSNNFDNNYYTIAAIIAAMLLIVLICLLLTFYEYIVISITDKSIQIVKKTLIFSSKITLDKNLIERIDYKVIKFPRANIILNFRLLFGFVNFKLPRIVYKGNEIFIFQNYNKEIRMWIINYLNSSKNN